ncbi:hypothetical protein GQ53DRAFT_846610 [Thozetella sp. PMI_491]|nr:hypothetical protein GQ53DRAFT_846610 [Thozetella sp. PMI_491]
MMRPWDKSKESSRKAPMAPMRIFVGLVSRPTSEVLLFLLEDDHMLPVIFTCRPVAYSNYHPGWTELDLSAVTGNICAYRRLTGALQCNEEERLDLLELMCKFERVEYGCGHMGPLRRVYRSCEVNRRWIEGNCRFNSRHHRIILIRTPRMCRLCQDYSGTPSTSNEQNQEQPT